jgi:hypothetical protein
MNEDITSDVGGDARDAIIIDLRVWLLDPLDEGNPGLFQNMMGIGKRSV